MTPMRDEGEPTSQGRGERRGDEAKPFRDSLFAAAVFGGVVLINGILAILLIRSSSRSAGGRSSGPAAASGWLRCRGAAAGAAGGV
jgi:hypothetical protein